MDTTYLNREAMEEPVKRSGYTVTSSILIIALLAFLFYWIVSRGISIWFFVVLVAVILVPVLWLSPTRVGYRDGEFYIKRLFRTKVIPIDRIREVRVFTPSPADGRICGVHGIFGRLGWYKSWEIGLYFAYVGDTDEAFLIDLKPDAKGRERKYVVSCRNNIAMVSGLARQLS